ncbi:MAG TPA: IS21 family transposase [Chitinispirillaceae bacterium]|nr:IS21 family transposase [Chitinispirillaceae bacterium]
MRKIREVLRYRYECKLSLNRIASALGLSKGSVHKIIEISTRSGLSWPLPADLTDSALEELFYKHEESEPTADNGFDSEYIHNELAHPHVTVELLWREYHDANPGGMSRATFFRKVRSTAAPLPPDMKMIYKGGDLLFIDYSGDGLFYINRLTGEIIDVELFVACWGASSYTYAEAAETQNTVDFCNSHANAFAFFKCVPRGLVPDNLKSGVIKANRYEPQLNPLYAKLAEHYSTAIIPARVREPKDKAPVESAVGFVQRYILGRLRNRQFFSLHEINIAIKELIVQLNDEPMQNYAGQTRRSRFEEIDMPNALPLRTERFGINNVKYDVGVGPNYHIRYDDHYYSVPSSLARQRVDVYLVGTTLEIYHDGIHVCRHLKQASNFQYTTVDEHMPSNHKIVRGWSPQWLIGRAQIVGPFTKEAAELILKKHNHPQQGFNSVMGILNLAKQYTAQRLELAAQRALRFQCATYRSIKCILEQCLDKEETLPKASGSVIAGHDNLRGPEYFSNCKQINE